MGNKYNTFKTVVINASDVNKFKEKTMCIMFVFMTREHERGNIMAVMG